MATHDILFNFRPNGQFPIDSRVVASNEAARYAIPAGAVYEGLVVYEELTGKLFLLDDASNANNIDGWTEINTGSSGTGGQSETSLFQSGAGGTLQETFWIGTKEQYDARSDDQKASETVHYITDDLTLVTGAGENTNTYLLSDFGITSTAAQIDHAAQELDGIALGDDIATADSLTIFTNKSGAVSQWTNDAGYLVSETSHSDVVDSNSTVTVVADSTQTNGGNVDSNGDITINVDLPDLSLLITRENVLNDDFPVTGLWDFRNATTLGIEGEGGEVTKAAVDTALGTGNQSADRFYTSNNGGSWENFPDTDIADGSITNAKLDTFLQTAITEAGTALQSLPTIGVSDLSQDVQDTLGEIDTALQTVPFGVESDEVAVWARGNNTTTQIPADILENALSSDTVRTYADVAAFTSESGVTWNKGDRAFFEDTNNYYFYTGTDGNTSVVLANDFVQLTVDDITTLTGYTALNGRVEANDAKTSFDSTSASKVGNISVTQPVDLDTMESNIETNNAKVTYNSTDSAKVGHLTVTAATDLDTMRSNVETNNGKVTYNSTDSAKVGHLTVTAATDLDTLRSNVGTNNSKVTYNSTDSTKVGLITVTEAVNLDTLTSDVAALAAPTRGDVLPETGTFGQRFYLNADYNDFSNVSGYDTPVYYYDYASQSDSGPGPVWTLQGNANVDGEDQRFWNIQVSVERETVDPHLGSSTGDQVTMYYRATADDPWTEVGPTIDSSGNGNQFRIRVFRTNTDDAQIAIEEAILNGIGVGDEVGTGFTVVIEQGWYSFDDNWTKIS